MDAFLLIGQLHRRLLVLLSDEINAPLQGLAQGARLLRGRLSSSSRRRLRELDATYAILRHVTAQRNEAFVTTIINELSRPIAFESNTPKTTPIDEDIFASFVVEPATARMPPAAALSVPRAAPAFFDISSSASSTSTEDMDFVDMHTSPPSSTSCSRSMDAIAQTVIDGSNSVVEGEPSSLVELATHNAACVLARSAAEAAQDICTRLVDALSAVLASAPAACPDAADCPASALAAPTPPPLACIAARALVRCVIAVSMGSGCHFGIQLRGFSHGPIRFMIVETDPSDTLEDFLATAEAVVSLEINMECHEFIQLIIEFGDAPLPDDAPTSSLHGQVFAGFFMRSVDYGQRAAACLLLLGRPPAC